VTPTPEVRRVPNASDPLFVDFVVDGYVTAADRLTLTPRVSRVRYFDDRGRDWTILPRRKQAPAAAIAILKRVTAAWRADLDDIYEKEMLEEQFVGATMVLLHKTPLEVAIADGRATAKLDEIDRVLADIVPEEASRGLRQVTVRFCRDAIAKVVVPVTYTLPDLRKGKKLTTDGRSYDVEKVVAGKRRASVRVSRHTQPDEAGTRISETLTFDARTGVVLEATSFAIVDSMRASVAKVGYTRWKTELKKYRAGSR